MKATHLCYGCRLVYQLGFVAVSGGGPYWLASLYVCTACGTPHTILHSRATSLPDQVTSPGAPVQLAPTTLALEHYLAASRDWPAIDCPPTQSSTTFNHVAAYPIHLLACTHCHKDHCIVGVHDNPISTCPRCHGVDLAEVDFVLSPEDPP